MNCFNLNETAQKQQLLKDENTFPIISVTLLSSTPAIPLNLHYSYGNCKLIWHTLTCFSSKTIKRAFNWKLTFISFQIKCHRSVCFWGGGQMGESICHKNYVFKNKLVATGFNANLFTNAATSCATVATRFSCKSSHAAKWMSWIHAGGLSASLCANFSIFLLLLICRQQQGEITPRALETLLLNPSPLQLWQRSEFVWSKQNAEWQEYRQTDPRLRSGSLQKQSVQIEGGKLAALSFLQQIYFWSVCLRGVGMGKSSFRRDRGTENGFFGSSFTFIQLWTGSSYDPGCVDQTQ